MERKGQAIIELLFAVMILFPLFGYMIDIYDQIYSNMIIMSASREGARWATRQSGLSSGEPNRPIYQAVWRACDYLAEATGEYSTSICPVNQSSFTTPNGITIKAGWWERNEPLLRTGVTVPLPSGPQQVDDEYHYRQVPIWVAIRWEKDRIIGFPPLNGKMIAVQQSTLMMDNY